MKKNIYLFIAAFFVCCFAFGQGTIGQYVPGSATAGFDASCGYLDAGGADPGVSDIGLAGNVCGSAFDVTFGAWTETAAGFDITGFTLSNYDIDTEAAYGIRLFYGPQNNCCTICLDAMLDLGQGAACGTFGPQASLASFGYPVPATYGADIFGADIIPYADMCPNTEYFAQYQFISATAVDLTDPDGNFCSMDDALITNAGTQTTVQTLVAPGTRDALVINSTTLTAAAAAGCGDTDVLLDFTADVTAGCTVSFGTCSQGLELEFRASLACADGSTLDITTGPLFNTPDDCITGTAFAGQISLGAAADVCAIFECDPAASLELYANYTFCEADDIVGDGSGNDEAVASVSIASIIAAYDAAACCVPPVCASTYSFTAPAEVCNGAAIDLVIDAGCDISLNTIDFGGGIGVDPALDLDLYVYAPGGVAGIAPAGYTVIPADIDGGLTGNADIIYVGTAGAATTVGNGCGDVAANAVGTFLNGSCDPLVVSYFIVPYTYDSDTDGDGDYGAYLAAGNAEACPVQQYDVTINPIFEIITDETDPCDQIAGAFISDGAGGFFDVDGDGALTFADACGTAQLGPACDGTTPATLDYDFSALDLGTCSGDLTGTLTCACPPSACTSTYSFTAPAAVCNGAAIDLVIDAGCDISLNTIDFGGGVGVDPALDLDLFIYAPGGVPGLAPAGYTVIPADIDGGLTGNPDIFYVGTAGTPTTVGSGCGDVNANAVGTFLNGTCDPLVVSYFIVPYTYDADTDGDGVAGAYLAAGNALACPVQQYDVTINPIFEIITDETDPCDQIAGAFISDGAGGFFDVDGDGALTFADACATDQLGPACDGTTPATLDYDFSALDLGTCSGDLTGTLTCACPPSACASTYSFTAPAAVCNGAAIDLVIDAGCDISLNTVDFGGGVGVDPALDLDLFIYAPGGVAGVAPAGYTVIPADIDGGLTGNADIIYLGTAGAPTTAGSGCGDIAANAVGTFLNGTCDPLVVSYFIVPYSYDADTDGDGTYGAYLAAGNALACPVQQYDVTINPILEVIEDVTDPCDQIAGAFISDGAGGFFDVDGDGALTFADACGTAQLGPACDGTTPATLDYDFAALDVGTCSGALAGTLTCACPPTACTISLTPPTAADLCDPNDGVGALAPLDLAACVGADGPVGTGQVFDVYVYSDFTNGAPAGYEGTAIPLAAEYPDPFGDGLLVDVGAVDLTCADAIGNIALTNPTCDPAIFTFIYFPFDYTLDTDGDLVAEYPQDCAPVRVDYTVYPTLTAALKSDDSGTCGDLVAALFDAAGTECAGTEQTVSCVNDGDALSLDFAASADGCTPAQSLTATCAGCSVAVCEIAVNITNFACDDGGTPEDPLDDTVTFDYTVTDIGGIGTTWSSDQGDAGAAYGTTVSVGPVPADGSTWTINVNDDADPLGCLDSEGQVLTDCGASPTDIPTLSEWGLITLALLLMTFGSVKMAVGSVALANTSSRNIPVPGGSKLNLPFDSAIFRKSFMITGLLALVGFAICFAMYATVFMSDIIGVAIAGPIFAYLGHLLYLLETRKGK